jgi:hypothetical protein
MEAPARYAAEPGLQTLEQGLKARLLRSAGMSGAWGGRVVDGIADVETTSALLEAALQIAPERYVEDVYGTDMLSSWAQRSSTARMEADGRGR